MRIDESEFADGTDYEVLSPPGTCQWARCGDGYVFGPDAGPEECDDGNENNNDGCPDGPGGTCQNARCGDGHLWLPKFNGAEDCDDGDDDRTDSCPSGPEGSCKHAFCGDEYIWTGLEACDDGNLAFGDGCTPDCLSDESCGNGYVDFNEQCDDGNQNNSDSCPDGSAIDAGPSGDGGSPRGECQRARCGDGHIWDQDGGPEECEDDPDCTGEVICIDPGSSGQCTCKD